MNAEETLYEGEKPYVFICYSHNDSGRVLPLLDAMRKHGYRFWYDKRIHPGEPWTKSLAEHLSNCAVFMPFLSPAFLQSLNCLDEVRYVHGKKNIVPVWLDKLDRNTISDELKFLFSNAQELRAYQFADADAFAARLDTEHIRPCRDADTVAASAELITNERPLERIRAISFDGEEKLLNSLNGESALEHCRKPRQENSVVPQKQDIPEKKDVPQKQEVPAKTEVPPKSDVPVKQEVPQKSNNVQSNLDTQRKENTKRTPPKDPKKPLNYGRSEKKRQNLKTNFDVCRSHFKVWSIIALITLALTILAHYTDEPRVYLAMEDEIRLYFWGGIFGCFITVNNLDYKFTVKITVNQRLKQSDIRLFIVMIFCFSRFFPRDISVRSFRNYACGNFADNRVNAACA